MGLKPSSRSCLPVTLDFEENVCREDVNFEIMSSRHNLSHKKRIRPPGGQILVSSGRTDFMGLNPSSRSCLPVSLDFGESVLREDANF